MSREHLRLPMHGRDHLPGGSDPIPTTAGSSEVPTVMLYSSATNMGDPDQTVSAYSSVTNTGGDLQVSFDHAIQPASNQSWYTLTGPPYDHVAITESGMYEVSAFAIFFDTGNVTWLGMEVICDDANLTDLPIKSYEVTRQVDDTATGLAGSAYSGQFNLSAKPLYIEAGTTGEAHLNLFHRQSYPITVPAEWHLVVKKLV